MTLFSWVSEVDGMKIMFWRERKGLRTYGSLIFFCYLSSTKLSPLRGEDRTADFFYFVIFKLKKTNPARAKKVIQEKKYRPIWITTRQHLKRFTEIVEATPWWRKYLLYRYEMSETFPQMTPYFFRIPVSFESIGELTMKEETIEFISQSGFFTFNVYASYHGNLRNLSFSIKRNQITALNRCDFASSLVQNKHLNWIVMTIDNDREILLYHAGVGYMDRQTDTLFTLLQIWRGFPTESKEEDSAK